MSQQVKVARELFLARGGRNGNEAAPVWTVQAYNNSGGALVRGDVVVWDKANSTADLIYITTTTTADDVDVLGMVYESIASTAVGKVQVWGPTDALKVDGTTDIARGNLLSTFTTAKIAQQGGVSGLFAVALEAYATNDSAGVIDAFLVGGINLPAGVGTHTHASNAQGGQIDWDDVFSDAAHNHSSAAEGGVTISGITMDGTWGGQPTWQSAQTMTLTTPTIAATGWTNANHAHAAANSGGQLDWDTAFSDAAHDHSSAAEGGVSLSGVTLAGTIGGQPTWQSAQTMTLTTPTIADFTNATHTHANAAGGGVTLSGVTLSGTIGGQPTWQSAQTMTLTTPTIADLTNATHTHANAAGGGNTLTIPTIGDFTNATHNHSNAAGGGVTLSTVTMSGTWSGQPTFNSSQTFPGATVSDGYNLKVGGTAAHGTTAGTNLISMFLGTAPTGTLASGGSLYVTTSTNVEVNWIDSGGNVSQLSAS